MRKKTLKKQNHYFQVLQLFAVVVFVSMALAYREQLNAQFITAAVLIYFLANIAHAAFTRQLDAKRVIEFGLIALICEFLILNFI